MSAMDIPTTDIREIGLVSELKAILEPATVIFAVQRGREENRAIVYGKQWLRTIGEGLVGDQECEIIGVIIDFATDELELLCAAVKVIKGLDEYESAEQEIQRQKNTKGGRQ